MNLYEHYGKNHASFSLGPQWGLSDVIVSICRFESDGWANKANEEELRKAWSLLKAVEGIHVPFVESPVSNLLKLIRMSYSSTVRNELFQERSMDVIKDTVYHLQVKYDGTETII